MSDFRSEICMPNRLFQNIFGWKVYRGLTFFELIDQNFGPRKT